MYDPALIASLSESGSGSVTAGSGGAGGAAGTAAIEPPPDMTPTGGTAPVSTGGAGGAGGAAGMAGTGGAAATGGTGGSDPGDAQCGGGLKCAGGACVDASSGSPPACTMGGTECDAYMGSSCAYDTMTMKGACLKSCGSTAMLKCPSPLMCKDFFGNMVCQDATGFPPPCTVGGNECDVYGFQCSTAAGITACWMNCSP